MGSGQARPRRLRAATLDDLSRFRSHLPSSAAGAVYVCSVCRTSQPFWSPRCTTCNRPFAIERRTRASYRNGRPIDSWVAAASLGEAKTVERIATGFTAVDTVLGGGLAAGRATLIFGPAGLGKTTLLLMIAAKCRRRALYVSGEQSVEELHQVAARCGVKDHPNLLFSATTDLANAEGAVRQSRAQVAVFDSAHVLVDPQTRGSAGSPSQIRSLGPRAKEFAANHNLALVVIGHTDKEGNLAGLNELPHAVDSVFRFDGPIDSEFRVLSCEGKNRDGSTVHRAVLRMTSGGLVEDTAENDPYKPRARSAGAP